MKKEFRNKLLSWAFALILFYPIGVDFAHIALKHHTGYQSKSIVQIEKVKTSCAVFHQVLNYNTPLTSNTYTISVSRLVETPIFFKPLKFHELNRFDFSLRAPPLC